MDAASLTDVSFAASIIFSQVSSKLYLMLLPYIQLSVSKKVLFVILPNFPYNPTWRT